MLNKNVTSDLAQALDSTVPPSASTLEVKAATIAAAGELTTPVVANDNPRPNIAYAIYARTSPLTTVMLLNNP